MPATATVVAWAAWTCNERVSASYIAATPVSSGDPLHKEAPRERGFFFVQLQPFALSLSKGGTVHGSTGLALAMSKGSPRTERTLP